MSNDDFLFRGKRYSLRGILSYSYRDRHGKEAPFLHLDWGSHDLLITGAEAQSLNRILSPILFPEQQSC